MTRGQTANNAGQMTDTSTATPAQAQEPTKEKARKDDNFFVFLLKLAVFVLVFRSFIFSPFSIPSESMLPRLENGD